MSVVVPFRRRKKPAPPPEEEKYTRCPSCGWKMPIEIRIDRASVSRELVMYFNCPECDASLILPLVFEPEEPSAS